jgi:hypothetical protein
MNQLTPYRDNPACSIHCSNINGKLIFKVHISKGTVTNLGNCGKCYRPLPLSDTFISKDGIIYQYYKKCNSKFCSFKIEQNC